ncbi:MAG: hypothetical protein D6706_22265, partial [Chloroflexi bacterium]
ILQQRFPNILTLNWMHGRTIVAVMESVALPPVQVAVVLMNLPVRVIFFAALPVLVITAIAMPPPSKHSSITGLQDHLADGAAMGMLPEIAQATIITSLK